MAARRLLIVLLVLFGVSTLAAALIPVPRPAQERTASPASDPEPAPRPRVLERTLDRTAKRPETIELRVGDFLVLEVPARRTGQVEVPRLGVLEDVGPYDPATLELAPPRPGAYPIRFVEPARVIARVRVRRASGCCRRAGRSAGTSRSR